ncbi:MAG: protein translocase subunit SecF [Candidatus Rokubacteria bacterium]|nr:protein translocase subunit SecF [Candidatus Rokubacteria bacterium]MBI3824805.1 protein translocase subunit SecF [Candidatus Rokubacteria bacterium]
MRLEIFRSPDYDFIGKRKWAYLVSALFTLAGLVSLATQGLNYDIDFKGGTLVQVRFEQPPSVQKIRGALATINLGEAVIQEFGDAREFIVRLPLAGASSQAVSDRMSQALGSDPSLGKFEIRRVEFVGPQVGRELQTQAVYAVLAAMACMLGYIAYRFRSIRGGTAAVVAVIHDVIVCLGSLSLAHREFSLPTLAAVLTVIGYSVNDTIVAYDRLRENRGRAGSKGKPFAVQMNDAVNQTLSRTVLTSLTVFFSVVILFFFGGRVLEDFAFVLVVGVFTGTYSTTYVAAAVMVDWTEWSERRGSGRGPKAPAVERPRPKPKAATKA